MIVRIGILGYASANPYWLKQSQNVRRWIVPLRTPGTIPNLAKKKLFPRHNRNPQLNSTAHDGHYLPDGQVRSEKGWYGVYIPPGKSTRGIGLQAPGYLQV